MILFSLLLLTPAALVYLTMLLTAVVRSTQENR